MYASSSIRLLLDPGAPVDLGPPVYPKGLPREALGMTVGLPTDSGPASPDSEHGGMHFICGCFVLYNHVNRFPGDHSFCACGLGGDCHCCTVRKVVRRSKDPSTDPPDYYDTRNPASMRPQHPHLPTPSQGTHDQIIKRITELRPVLPRPPYPTRGANGPHNPSHGRPSRHHEGFSPYPGAIHDYPRGPNHSSDPNTSLSGAAPQLPPLVGMGGRLLHSDMDLPSSWRVRDHFAQRGSPNTTQDFLSPCGCSGTCQCPGCVEHAGPNVAPSPSAFSTCANPGACATCLDCTILSLPASLPPNTASSAYDSYQAQSIDDWIRQISSLPPLPPSSSPSFASQPQSWNPMDLSRVLSPSIGMAPRPSGCANCRCPPGLCQCNDPDPNRPGQYLNCSSDLSYPIGQESSWTDRPDVSQSQGYRQPPLDSNAGLYMQPNSYYGFADDRHSRTSSRTSFSSEQSFDEPAERQLRPRGVPLSRHETITQHQIQSTPNLMIRTSGNSSSSCSASSSSSNCSSSYAHSNSDSDGPDERTHSPYDPSLDGMQIY